MTTPSSYTPLFRQWEALKQQHPDVLVLFRLGDFYEMFGEDAQVGARELGLVLTSRECGPGRRIPMCGLPHHALQRYLVTLVQKGFRVALADQMEDPRQAKGLVRREVTRVVSAGTVLEDGLILKSQAHLFASRAAPWDASAEKLRDTITGRLNTSRGLP